MKKFIHDDQTTHRRFLYRFGLIETVGVRFFKRELKKVGIIVCALALLATGFVFGINNFRSSSRRAWKKAALPEIARLAQDKRWVAVEISKLSASTNAQDETVLEPEWLTDRMILMKSGEWLVYKSHCSKASPHLVSDIFLAQGSNGKWYYSTCHFCVGMVALRGMQDEPPPDLKFFVKRYALAEFDGHSDECLKPTRTFPAE